MSLPDVVVAPRTDPIYNAHGYLTKVPVSAIQPFIRTFSKPGDVVLDPFAGSGMTGIAAAMTGRNAELSDISVLGHHIGTGYLTSVDGDELEALGTRIADSGRKRIGSLYRTQRAEDGADVEWVRTLWSFVYQCPDCDARLNFYEAVKDTGQASPKQCPSCSQPFRKKAWTHVDDVPVAVVVRGGDGKQVEQPIQELDRERIDLAAADKRQRQVPSIDIDSQREMYRRSGLGRWGLTKTHLFFTARNALALVELRTAIDKVEQPALRQKLRFAFTAILPRASRRYQWGPKRPLNAQNQTYYISPVHYEWNVFELFVRKVRAMRRAQDYQQKNTDKRARATTAKYTITSADTLEHVADCSVDYVFTDPPFGSNIFYSDMNLFQEAWLDGLTDHAREAVIHTGKARADAAETYEAIITGAFREAYRTLKPGRCMSVVFGNSRGSVWSMVQRALRASGFDPTPVHLALLDKGQRSVKGLTSGRERVVTVDMVLTVRKPKRPRPQRQQVLALEMDRLTLVQRALAELPPEQAANPSYVYVATVREAVKQRMAVDHLHLSDVLRVLSEAGYTIDPKSGRLNAPATAAAVQAKASR